MNNSSNATTPEEFLELQGYQLGIKDKDELWKEEFMPEHKWKELFGLMNDYSLHRNRIMMDEFNKERSFSHDLFLKNQEYIAENKTLRDKFNSVSKFNMPTDKQLVDIALIFNNGKIDQEKLTDMVGMAMFILDRLHEHNDVSIPSSKETGNHE